MKQLLWVIVLLAGGAPLLAQDSSLPEGNRMFFPKDTFWGFAQFDLSPPHNEVDPNICSANAGDYGGVNAPCTAFGRYMFWGTVEARPFGKGIWRRFMLFGEGHFVMGKNIPHTLYTWSFDPIGIEHDWGGAVYVGKGFEVRATQHFLFTRLGSIDGNLGPAYLGSNGPWGRYNAIGVRKYFGTRRW
jgi:hypothetical protein